MKAVNSKERKKAKLKFFGMYGITTILLVIILSSFWAHVPYVKKRVKEELVTDTANMYVPQKASVSNNSFVDDSLRIAIASYNRKIEALEADLVLEKNTIEQLQKQKPANNKTGNAEEVAKLNKQVEFLDWALRSQVAVTNTLTKENNRLKSEMNDLKPKNPK